MSSDTDTQCLIEHGDIQLLEVPAQPKRSFGRAAAVLAALGCVAGAAVLVGRRGAAMQHRAEDDALREGMTELVLSPPAACSAYTDCASLPGNCCPTAEGNTLGCCNSPRLDTPGAVLSAAPAEVGVAPDPIPGECQDTFGWTNGYTQCNSKGYTAAHGCMPTGLSCMSYDLFGWCANGAAVSGKAWTQGDALNNPEVNCCVCGKPPNPPAAEATYHAPTLGPPAVPSIAPVPSAGTLAPAMPANVPVPPTSAPLGGGAAPNGTQGEPVGADCAMNSGCASLGIAGQCCPTADGMMLGCCSSLGDAGPPALKPAATGPGPIMTTYMYRVANDEDYPINGVNMANLAGDMWYLHNEVVQHCPRKFNMERLLRFRVTFRATSTLYGQSRNFDSFVAFDQAKCTVPMCEQRHWTPFGYVVGCQPNNVGQVAVPGSPTWYSLPGTCPNKFYYEKTAECNSAEPGGACPTADVTGERNCTYYLERAGEIRLDELTGLTDYNKVCQETGVREFDMDKDMGVGTKFWNGKTDASAGARRTEAVKALFAKKFPSMPADLDDPTCDVEG